MAIDKIYYLNLDTRTDRAAGQQAVCGVMGVPIERLARIRSHDSAHYENRQAIVAALAADGFAEYAKHYQHYDEEWPTETVLATQWTHLTALRQILDSNETTLVLEDDTFLAIPFSELEEKMRQVPDIQVLYLDHNPFESGVEDALEPTRVAGLFSNFLGSSCRARVYTPQGAERMKTLMERTGHVIEWVPSHLQEYWHEEHPFHLLQGGAKDIGWIGYHFEKGRSDIVARDVTCFNRHVEDRFKYGVVFDIAK